MPGEVVQGGGGHSGPVLDQGHRDQEGRKQIRRQQLDQALRVLMRLLESR